MSVNSKRFDERYKMAIRFHLPTFLILTLITLGPLLYALYISFFDFRLSNPKGEHTFVGLKNYIEVFTKPEALNSILTTVKYVVIAVVFQVFLAVVLALSLNELPRFQRLFVMFITIPMMVAPLIVGLMFSFFWNPQFGLYAYLVNTLHLPLPATPLSDRNLALWYIAFTDVWEWTPYLVLTFLAGLQSIPGESFEAAKVDGASGLQVFRKITIPLMAPILAVGLVLRAMEAFKEFDKPYILTGGGPGSATEVIDLYTYRQAFVSFNFSKAAALCIVLFVLLLTAGILYGKFVLERNKE